MLESQSINNLRPVDLINLQSTCTRPCFKYYTGNHRVNISGSMQGPGQTVLFLFVETEVY